METLSASRANVNTPKTMLPITLKCVCGAELEVIPKSLRELSNVAKANEWKVIGRSRAGHDYIAALCPNCAIHEKKIHDIGTAIG